MILSFSLGWLIANILDLMLSFSKENTNSILTVGITRRVSLKSEEVKMNVMFTTLLCILSNYFILVQVIHPLWTREEQTEKSFSSSSVSLSSDSWKRTHTGTKESQQRMILCSLCLPVELTQKDLCGPAKEMILQRGLHLLFLHPQIHVIFSLLSPLRALTTCQCQWVTAEDGQHI